MAQLSLAARHIIHAALGVLTSLEGHIGHSLARVVLEVHQRPVMLEGSAHVLLPQRPEDVPDVESAKSQLPL